MQTYILIVDDEPAVTDLLTYNLRKASYEVRVAADGREALRLARETRPDLILLDVMIPEMDGLDVCRELRKTSTTPVIMIRRAARKSTGLWGWNWAPTIMSASRSACVN
jgi:DNA-binding response OmpR family regulator